MLRRETWRHFDYLLFGTVILLCAFGIVMIRSAIAGNEELANSVRNQIIFVALGMVLILVLAAINYRTWASTTRLLYIGGILLLVGIYLIGDAAFGSRRWFSVGGINIQPSELGKIILIITLANYFSNTTDDPHDLMWILKSFAITMGITIWVLLQPNLSTAIVLLVIWFSMLWISGLKTRHILGAVGIGMVLLVVMLVLILNGQQIPFLEDYQLERIQTFLFPDPNATHGEGYTIQQALISIGSGGWFGTGYGSGPQVQLRFLKVRHTDFIFSAIAEEFGFVGITLVMAALIFVVIRCLSIARRSMDTFGALIAYGIAILIFFQMAVNIGVNLQLLPVTGLTLPFISYGGSSLLSLVLGIGLVESVAVHSQTLDF